MHALLIAGNAETNQIFRLVQINYRKIRVKKEVWTKQSINLSCLQNVYKLLMLMIKQFLIGGGW